MLHHATTPTAVRRLRAARQRLSLSVGDVAARAGMPAEDVRAIETGVWAEPTLTQVASLARAVGVPIGVLCELDDGGFDRALHGGGTPTAQPLAIEALTDLASIETAAGVAVLRSTSIERTSVLELPTDADGAALANALSRAGTFARLVCGPVAGGGHRTLLAIQAQTLNSPPVEAPAALAARLDLGARALTVDEALTALCEHAALLPAGTLDQSAGATRLSGPDLRARIAPLGLAADERGVYAGGRAAVAHRFTALPGDCTDWLGHVLGRSGVTISLDLTVIAPAPARQFALAGAAPAPLPQAGRETVVKATGVALTSAATLDGALARADELTYACAEVGIALAPQPGRHAYAYGRSLPAGPDVAAHDDVFELAAPAVAALAAPALAG